MGWAVSWWKFYKDVSFRVLPLTPTNARKMIEQTRSYPILNGARGKPPLDKQTLRKLLMLCSEIVEAYPEILEMDLNPVIVHEGQQTWPDESQDRCRACRAGR